MENAVGTEYLCKNLHLFDFLMHSYLKPPIMHNAEWWDVE
jgi:hypothetical protein